MGTGLTMVRRAIWWLAIATVLAVPEPFEQRSDVQERGLGRFDDLMNRNTYSEDTKNLDSSSKGGKGKDGGSIATTSSLAAFNTMGSCQGYATYYGNTPSTVYATVTETFDVTVGSNATFTDQATLYTPPDACFFTILSASLRPTFQSNTTLTSMSSPTPPFNNFTQVPSESQTGGTNSHPGHPGPDWTESSGDRTAPTPFTSNSFTGTVENPVVTVTVTKKTPVRKTPTVTTPAVQFPTNPPENSPTLGGGGPPSNAPSNNPPQSDPPPQPDSTNQTPGRPTDLPGGSGNPPVNSFGQPVNPTAGFGSIINSIINSPFVPASTSFGTAAPSNTLLEGVPVQFGPSSVFFGGQTIPLPSASQQTTVVVNGETFTVRPTEVVFGSSTITFSRQESISQGKQSLTVMPLATSTVTQNGVTITIGPSQAVLSLTTYRIGPNAPAKTVTVNAADGHKETVTFDSDGVVFPSTTYNPALTVMNPFVITTIGPHITVSIDMSEAVLSGTTYHIGSGASASTTIVDGTTVVFGPSGVVVPGMTTIPPTSVSVTTTSTNTGTSVDAAATKAGSSASASQTAGSSNAAAAQRLEKIYSFGTGGLMLFTLVLGVFL